jgi:hypothetical protein
MQAALFSLPGSVMTMQQLLNVFGSAGCCNQLLEQYL